MQNVSKKLTLENIHVDEGELVFNYSVDTHEFTTKVYYQKLNFTVLKNLYGEECINNIIFHIAFIEGMKYCSLAPKEYDITGYSHFVNDDLIHLFEVLYKNIFAQHKWENDLPDYPGPELIYSKNSHQKSVTTINRGKTEVLFSCGGGKDSLVSMKLLERAEIPYGVYQYSHSVYGQYQKQHALIDRLVEVCNPLKQHKMYVIDDFLDSPVLTEHYANKIKTLCAPETPCAVFESLPLMLNSGYTNLCVGHERGADSGNFYWEKIQQEVNHQWGKSYEAEVILNLYIQEHLLTNFHFFSIIKPIYDFLIFQLLKRDQNIVDRSQSCNVEKPWCRKCPKCAYVWLCYMAYLDIGNIFTENLFDEPVMVDLYMKMMGVKDFKPFECIGEIDETRLALYFCYKKGIKGKVMDIFIDEILPETNFEKILNKYNTVYPKGNIIPPHLKNAIVKQLQNAVV